MPPCRYQMTSRNQPLSVRFFNMFCTQCNGSAAQSCTNRTHWADQRRMKRGDLSPASEERGLRSKTVPFSHPKSGAPTSLICPAPCISAHLSMSNICRYFCPDVVADNNRVMVSAKMTWRQRSTTPQNPTHGQNCRMICLGITRISGAL